MLKPNVRRKIEGAVKKYLKGELSLTSSHKGFRENGYLEGDLIEDEEVQEVASKMIHEYCEQLHLMIDRMTVN